MVTDEQRQELAEWFSVEQQIHYTAEEFKDEILEKVTEIIGRIEDPEMGEEIGIMLREWANDEAFADNQRNAGALRYVSNFLMSPRIPVTGRASV